MPAELIHQKCTSLQERVSACESLLDVLDGLKYIDGNPVALEDGSGYQLNVVSVTKGENNQWTVKNEEPIVIKHGSKGADGHTPVVTIKDGNWWIDDVDTGEKAVPADGKDAPTPTFHIWDGVLWYTFAEKPDTSDNGKPTAEDTKGWTSLGNVVGPKGETGEQGPQGPEGIHGLEITRVTDVNDPNYGAVKISYNNGEEIVTEYLPTYEMFLELKTKVEDAEENISALLSLVTALQTQTFVTGYEFIKEKGVIVGCKVSTVKVVLGPDGKTYTTQTGTSEIRPNDLIKLDKDERGWYWSIPEADGTASKHYLDAEKTFVPDFEIINGHLYVSLKDGANQNNINDAAYWKDLGTVQTILAGHDGEDAEVTPNDPLVSIEQKDGKVIFTFAGSSPIEVPTQTAFAALVGRVTALEQNAATFNSLFNSLKDYEFVKNFEIEKDDKGNTIGFKITFASYTEKYEDGKFVGYDWKIETKTINYKDAGLLSFTVKDGDYYWVLPDGTEIPVDGTFVPEFRINEADGKLYVSLVEEPGEDFSNENKWKCLGLVTPELAEDDKIIVSIEEEKDEAGKMTGYLVITFRNPSNDDLETLRLPTAAAFKQLQDDVAAANSNIVALQKAVAALEAYDHVLSFEPKYDSTGKVIIGYHFKFKNSGDVYIYDGKTPSVRINEDGNWEVSYDGTAWEEVKDKDGKPVSAIGIQGENGKTPTFKIDENGEWRISWDGGASWEDKSLGQATGKDGDAFFESVTELDLSRVVIDPLGPNKDATPAYLRIKLTNGKIYEIPTQYAIAELQKQVDQLTSNVSALQQFAEGQTYIVSYEENADKTGYILKTKKYDATTKTWVESTITIYHGTNGTNGTTPTIKINNEGYWVINDTDTGVKAAGENGKTPLFKIVEGQWYYSYEKTNTGDNDVEGWTKAGQATGDPGASGDAFFESVSEIKETITYDTGEKNSEGDPISKTEEKVTYIVIKLVGGGEYKIPTEYEIKRLSYVVRQVNNDVIALQTTVNALESNQHIISYEPYTENGVEVGYKLKLTDGTDEGTDPDVIIIRHGAKGATGDAPEIRIGEDGYWYIGGVKSLKATGENGKTPLFKIVEGQWYYSYEKTNTGDNDIEGWTKAGQATGDPGTSGDAFFEAIIPVYLTDNEGTPIVDEAGNKIITYIKIILKDDDNDTDPNFSNNTTYKIPTEYTILRLQAQVDVLNTEVAAYKDIVNGKITVTEVVPIDKDGNTVSEDKAAGYRIEFSDPTKNFTIWHGTDAALVTIGDNGNWFIGSTDTGVSAYAKTPIFKVVNGTMYYTFEGSADDTDDVITSSSKWFSAGSAQGAQGDSFFTGVVPVYITSETALEGYVKGDNDLYYKLENGEKIIAFLRFTLSESGRTIDVPTEWTTRQIETRMTTVETNLELFNNIFKGRSFIESVVEKTDENGIVLGYEVKTVTLDENLNINETKTTLINGLVRPYQVDGLWHCEILTYDEDGNAVYVPVASGASSLSYIVVGQYLWLSTDPKAAADLKTEDFTPVEGTNGWKRVVALPYLDTGANLGKVQFTNESVTFNFGPNAITVPRFFKKPEFSFSSEFIDDNNVFVYPKQGTGYETLNFKIIGSFAEKPEIHIVCEGNWRSKNLQYDRESETEVSGSVGIQPTSAYSGDDCSGRLSLYISYYGNTYITQLDLSAEGSLEYEELSLDEYNKASFSITTDMIPDGQLPVIAYNYGDEFRWIHSTVERDDSTPGKFKITVNCDRNIGGERTGTIVVFNQKGGRELLRLRVPQEGFTGKIHNLAHPTGTGAIVPANCYIITGKENTTNDPNFLYMIPAYKGNDTDADKFRGIKKYEVLWNDSGNSINIDPDSQLDEMILFTVTGSNPGNAVIAIKDKDDKILWSWHLWFCPGGVPETNSYGNYNMMDRNLGAASATTAGAYYQWGRKDPFFGSTQNPVPGGNAQEVAHANPTTFYSDWNPSSDKGWSSSKSSYDPCPPGYKVPGTSVLASAKDRKTTADYTSLIFVDNSTNDGIYPLHSYLTSTAVITEDGQNVEAGTLMPITKTQKKASTNSVYEGFLDYYPVTVTYTYEHTVKYGGLWTYMEGEKIHYSAEVDRNPKYENVEVVGDAGNNIINQIVRAFANGRGQQLAEEMCPGIVWLPYYNPGVAENESNGLQVRCVKE